MTLGNKIKESRVKKGYTQKDLADFICFSYQTVSEWENDTNEADIATLIDISIEHKSSVTGAAIHEWIGTAALIYKL